MIFNYMPSFFSDVQNMALAQAQALANQHHKIMKEQHSQIIEGEFSIVEKEESLLTIPNLKVIGQPEK